MYTNSTEHKKEKEKKHKSNSSQRNNDKVQKKRLWQVLDHWVLIQLLAVFSLSFAVGILFMHGTILWHQYKHGYGYWGPSVIQFDQSYGAGFTLDQIPHIKNDIYEWSDGRLKVNTTYFVR